MEVTPPPSGSRLALCEVFGLKTPGKPPAPPEVETQEVLAYDRLDPSKKTQPAEQWVDVTVVSFPQ